MAGTKGATFERDISRKLSLWWTHGERDDVFWRSSMSGGRATVRAKQGKTTAYQNGDITATDPIGAPLIANVVIELKRGYKRWCVLDMVDSPKPEKSTFATFLAQVREECKNAGVSAYMLICKRDGRKPIVICPTQMLIGLNAYIVGKNGIKDGLYAVHTLDAVFTLKPELFLRWVIDYNRFVPYKEVNE